MDGIHRNRWSAWPGLCTRKWKASELDAGHFVECVRRLLEYELTGSYTPFASKLPNFTDQVLRDYEQRGGDESFRILIPRALKAIYNIRNKRGVGHIAGVSPNKMDSMFILYTVKWVLAELLRLSSSLPIPQAQALVDKTVDRQIESIWKEGPIVRVLDQGIKTRDQILILLYDNSPQKDTDLQSIIEYTNVTRFKAMLREMHKERLIEYRSDGQCFLSPKGSLAAEHIIQGLSLPEV